MKRTINTLLVGLLAACLAWAPSLAYAQDPPEEPPSSGEFQLAVPLLEGHEAPFSGILLSEDDFRLALELDAAADRWQTEARVFQRQLETERSLYESHISAQRDRIRELSQHDWWDDNGNWVMLGLGIVVGIVASALLVGLANN